MAAPDPCRGCGEKPQDLCRGILERKRWPLSHSHRRGLMPCLSMSLGKRADAPGEEWLPKVRNSLNTFALDSTVSTTPIRGSEASSNRFEPSVPRDERQISSWCQSDSSTQRLPTTCKEQAKESFYILLSTVHPFNLFHSWLTCRALWWIWGEDFQVESSTQGCTQGCAQEPRRHRSTRFHFSCHGTSAGPVIFVPPLARSRGTNSGGGTKTM